MSIAQTVQLADRQCLVRYCTPAEALAPPTNRRFLYLTDNNVLSQVKPMPIRQLPGSFGFDERQILAWPAGETAKAWPQVAATIERGFELGLARDDFMIGVGGGVVCDLAGFAASVYLRGCQLILVPTSLLAMVDAAFGGKTGINFAGYKNMVGTFYPANELRVAPQFLQSLPELEYKSGLGEVIKHALLSGSDQWRIVYDQRAAILARDQTVLEKLVRDSLAVKIKVVQADFKENNVRVHLNLGHTFGHALEAVAGFGGWTHGEAVAWGLVQATALSARLGLCSSQYAGEVKQLIQAYGYRTKANLPAPDLLAAMGLDKKKKGGVVRFVLQRGLGQTLDQPVVDEDILAVLENQS